MNSNKKEKLIWELENKRITIDELIEVCYNKGVESSTEYKQGYSDGVRSLKYKK